MSAGAHFLDPLTPLATILNVRETDEPGEEMGARPRPLHRALERPPEAWLKKALDARSAAEKEEFALLGLRALDRAEEDDEELRALLLKQSYDALMAMGQTRDALERAEEIIDLGPLGDVARHDAARAAAALGEIEVAADHLRIAAKVAPEERRAFHFGTLGALLRFAGLAEDAREAFKKAERWADADRAIYRAQRALAEGDAGVGPGELGRAAAGAGTEPEPKRLCPLGARRALRQARRSGRQSKLHVRLPEAPRTSVPAQVSLAQERNRAGARNRRAGWLASRVPVRSRDLPIPHELL
ncbi:MAG: hypothetical protein B6A08_18310 [Sorangiineae bacterium NIC37A_2]|nr:MAG: hypothetical protein B6A08_18310 [Sorangiineae bacterium NIC37A_2]